MWTLTGPFDSNVVGELNFQKCKLLRTGKSYALGRKDQPLLIASKKISSYQCDFVIGQYSPDDVAEPTSRPKIKIVNKRNKAMILMREDDQLIIGPMAAQELQDGDVIAIISGIPVTVKWYQLCCYVSPKSKTMIPVEGCVSLGINLVHLNSQYVTHHLTNNYMATSVIAASLMTACQLVKPDWLHEVIRLGTVEKVTESSESTALEDNFRLPLISKFRPTFSPSLSPSHKIFKLWEPNEERLNMFARYRFICVGEKGKEVSSDLREVISRGGGAIETFDVHSGVTKWNRALTRGQAKEGKQVVLVGDKEFIQTAIGNDGWKALASEAKLFSMHFIKEETIIQTVLEVDTSNFEHSAIDVDLEESTTTLSSLPNFVPNTLSNEPSILPAQLDHEPEPEVPAPRKRPVRRVTSRQASEEPSQVKDLGDTEDVVKPVPRRTLTRRVNAGQPVVTGLDDPSTVLDAKPILTEDPIPPSPVIDLTAPSPARPKKLKRRLAGTGEPNLASILESHFPTSEVNEPPYKRHKALYEASNPNNQGGIIIDDELSIPPGSQGGSDNYSQTQTQNTRRNVSRGTLPTEPDLEVLREEEEETPTGNDNVSQGRHLKRRLESTGEDVEMGKSTSPDNVDDELRVPLAKKRAIENHNAVEPTHTGQDKPDSIRSSHKPSSTAKDGRKKTTLDTDAEFLKAIASKKRGKKTEDEFDREFNQLRISKPDITHEDQEKEWGVLADFGDDSGLRGNFMVVVELEPYPRTGSRVRNDIIAEWDSKPNFKKFKKKDSKEGSRPKIELFANEEMDYGMGAAYWKSGGSQSQSQTFVNKKQTQGTPVNDQNQPPNGRSQPLLIDDSDDDVPPNPKSRSKPPSRSQQTRERSVRTNSKPLFFDSDDDIVQEGEGEEDEIEAFEETETLKSTASKKPPVKEIAARGAKLKKGAAVIVDDDSDDGAVFKGFKGKRRGR